MTFFGIRLQSLRKQDGINQTTLAKALGVSRSAVGMWETGEREPDFETLEAIADYFNVPIGTFFPDGNYPAQSPFKTEQDLTPFEREILSKLRLLSEDQQRAFLAYLITLLDMQSP